MKVSHLDPKTPRGLLLSALAMTMMLPLGASASGSLSPGGGTDPSVRGRTVFLKQIACERCPVPEGLRDKDSARALIERVQADEFDLSTADRRAVVTYIKRRWRVR